VVPPSDPAYLARVSIANVNHDAVGAAPSKLVDDEIVDGSEGFKPQTGPVADLADAPPLRRTGTTRSTAMRT
jgi:hypothetical protein